MNSFIRIIISSVLLFSCAHATLKVGIIGKAPFVMGQEADLEGISLRYWEAVADISSIDYSLHRMDSSFDEAVAAVNKGEIDVLVGPVSVTYERSQLVEFSRPYFINQTGLVVRVHSLSFFEVISTIFGTSLAWLLGVFIFLLGVFTYLFYLCERQVLRRQNSWQKLGNSLWTTVSSFLRDVLYDPKSVSGRVILGVWLLLSVVFMALFTAIVTASMTYMVTMGGHSISYKHDLVDAPIAVMAGSTHVVNAKKLGARIVSFVTYDEAFKLLRDGKVEGIIGDYTVLDYFLTQNQQEQFRMSEISLMNDEHAFVFQKGSPVIPKVNQAILKMQFDGLAAEICRIYLGPNRLQGCDF